MRYLSEIISFPGAFDTLRELEASTLTTISDEALTSILEYNDVEDPPIAIQDLVAGNVLRRSGNEFSLTSAGIRSFLLLEAINGGDLRDTFRRLGHIDSSIRTYELIREGMTTSFLKNLVARPGFGRLYICSPWISLDTYQEQLLAQAVKHVVARRRWAPEILVLTRPEQGTKSGISDGANTILKLGATLYLNSRLHTKLYIREPDFSGGLFMAIVGSQNLTKSHYFELGIRINSDSQMINMLVAYFLEIANQSNEFREE